MLTQKVTRKTEMEVYYSDATEIKRLINFSQDVFGSEHYFESLEDLSKHIVDALNTGEAHASKGLGSVFMDVTDVGRFVFESSPARWVCEIDQGCVVMVSVIAEETITESQVQGAAA